MWSADWSGARGNQNTERLFLFLLWNSVKTLTHFETQRLSTSQIIHVSFHRQMVLPTDCKIKVSFIHLSSGCLEFVKNVYLFSILQYYSVTSFFYTCDEFYANSSSVNGEFCFIKKS